MLLQIGRYQGYQSCQVMTVLMYDEKVIHIAAIMLAAQGTLDIVVKRIEIDIGE